MTDAIHRIVFDLEVDSAAVARPLQQRVSRFSSDSLRGVLAECMDAFDHADTAF